jgi:hypothetical protein
MENTSRFWQLTYKLSMTDTTVVLQFVFFTIVPVVPSHIVVSGSSVLHSSARPRHSWGRFIEVVRPHLPFMYLQSHQLEFYDFESVALPFALPL